MLEQMNSVQLWKNNLFAGEFKTLKKVTTYHKKEGQKKIREKYHLILNQLVIHSHKIMVKNLDKRKNN